MDAIDDSVCRYFISYSGVGLPLKLVSPLDTAELENRNTYFRGYFADDERLVLCQKIVYGEVELEHRYVYHDNGQLQSATIRDFDDDSEAVVCFDSAGNRI